ncbi:MAG: hypothetical protein AB7K08_07255 [Microbacteriaceae bacterium]
MSRLIELVDRLPGPPWATYLVGAVFFIAMGTVLGWLDGSQPVTTSPWRRGAPWIAFAPRWATWRRSSTRTGTG